MPAGDWIAEDSVAATLGSGAMSAEAVFWSSGREGQGAASAMRGHGVLEASETQAGLSDGSRYEEDRTEVRRWTSWSTAPRGRGIRIADERGFRGSKYVISRDVRRGVRRTLCRCPVVGSVGIVVTGEGGWLCGSRRGRPLLGLWVGSRSRILWRGFGRALDSLLRSDRWCWRSEAKGKRFQGQQQSNDRRSSTSRGRLADMEVDAGFYMYSLHLSNRPTIEDRNNEYVTVHQQSATSQHPPRDLPTCIDMMILAVDSGTSTSTGPDPRQSSRQSSSSATLPSSSATRDHPSLMMSDTAHRTANSSHQTPYTAITTLHTAGGMLHPLQASSPRLFYIRGIRQGFNISSSVKRVSAAATSK